MKTGTNKHRSAWKRVGKTSLKILVMLLLLPFILLLLLLIALRFQKSQDFIASKAAGILSKKINSEVRIGSVSLRLNEIVLHDLMVKDRQHDTLLYSKFLAVNFKATDLLDNTVTITGIHISDLYGRITRNYPDSNYNFSFIPQAFASSEEEPAEIIQDTLPSAWKFRFGEIGITHSRFYYSDNGEGLKLDARIGDFRTNVENFDIDHLDISIKDLLLKNCITDLRLTEPLDKTVTQDDSSATAFNLLINKTDLQNISLALHDDVGHIELRSHIGSFSASGQRLDLEKQLLVGKAITFENSQVTYKQDVTNNTQVVVPKADSVIAVGSLPWIVKQQQLYLDGIYFSYNNKNAKPVSEGMDYQHLQIRDLHLEAENITTGTQSTLVQLNSMRFAESSGFKLKDFAGLVSYEPTSVSVTNMKLQTGNSTIEKDLQVNYSSLEELATHPGKVGLKVDLHGQIGLRDLRYFAPFVFNDSLLNKSADGNISILVHAQGSLDALRVKKMEVRTKGAELEFMGELKSIMQPSDLYLSLSQIKLNVKRDKLLETFSKTLLPSSVNIPDSLRLAGSFTGYAQNFNADIDLYTTSGTLLADITMDPEAGNTRQPYKGHFSTDNLDLGFLLKDPQTFGKISVMADVDGSGFDTSDLNTSTSLVIARAEILKYNYTNFELKGQFVKSSFTGSASINDKNVAFDFTGAVDLDRSRTAYRGNLNLKGIDLHALHLSDQDIRVSLAVTADAWTAPGVNPTGTARVTNILLVKNEKRYQIDSLVVRSVNEDHQNSILVRSDLCMAELKGKYFLHELGGKFIQHVNTYFSIAPIMNDSVYRAQDYQFSFQLLKPQIFSAGLIPGLQQLTTFSMSGSFNSTSKELKVEADLPRITYNGISIDSLKFNVNSDAAAMNYKTTLSQVADSTFKFENIFLGGVLKNNTATFDFNTSKDDSTKMLDIGGQFTKVGKDAELRLNERLVLNAEDWNIQKENLMRFGQGVFYAKDVSITRENHLLSLNSPENRPTSPVDITFKNFEIGTVSRLLEYKEGLVQGNINGFVQLEQQNGKSAFKSDLEIRDFVYKASPIGTIKLKADNYVDIKKYDLALEVEGYGNHLTMDGSYNTALQKNNLDLVLEIKKLQLASVEPFTGGQATRMSGSVSGRISIKGEPVHPRAEGAVQLQDVAFNPKIIDSYLKIPGGVIEFGGEKIKMNNLVLYDTLDNSASLNGYVDISNFSNPGFNLRLKTEDFLALNTNRKSNPLYYGRILLKSDISITGTSELPVIDVKARLNKGSRLTYVKPESEIGKEESNGVVEFTDSLNKYSAIMEKRDTALITHMKGIDLHAAIEVDRSVDLKIIVDPLAGDSLFLKGGGKLDFTLDRSGKTSLTGKYNINDGGYYLTISDFVKRSFKIMPGSSVTWSGDLLDAYMDLTAIYSLKASPIDLVQDVSDLELAKYRNQLNFDVYLKMAGFISKPEITFDIQLAPRDRGALNGAVDTRLSQLREDENQMNKQVFALLTLKRFVGENPLESQSEGGFTSASRSSASKILTNQLNNLSDKYVNFVDLDLGVNSYEDYSTGQLEGRTQLQLGVSKQMFNDRITVRVGGNVELEGERAKQNNANDLAGNINIDYKLTEDGRYKLKVFRENNYENPIEGELTKTGTGVVLTRDFNKFKNLFRKPGKRNDKNRKK